MKNLYLVAMLAAALAGGTLESASAQSASKTGIKNVVLVHGAFAGKGEVVRAEYLAFALRIHKRSTQALAVLTKTLIKPMASRRQSTSCHSDQYLAVFQMATATDTATKTRGRR
jgi:hypothetical protein